MQRFLHASLIIEGFATCSPCALSMPIYAYKCESCGFAKDVLQKMSDAPLTDCPGCGQPALRKQVTAAGFQLKGSGWYVTDFKGGAAASSAPPVSGAATAGSGDNNASAGAGGSGGAASASAAPASSTSGASDGASAASSGSSAATASSKTTPSGQGG